MKDVSRSGKFRKLEQSFQPLAMSSLSEKFTSMEQPKFE
jgi:hypothetical protein